MHYYRGPRRQNNRAKFSCCQVRLSERNDSHEEHAAISPAMFTFHCRGIAMHIRALHFKNQSIRGVTGEGPVNCSFHKSLSNGHAQLTSFGTGMYMYMYMRLISPSRCYSPDDLLCSFHSWRADYFLFKLPQQSSKLQT